MIWNRGFPEYTYLCAIFDLKSFWRLSNTNISVEKLKIRKIFNDEVVIAHEYKIDTSRYFIP